MLSCMETNLGLMVVGPMGQPLRIPRGHPAYQASKTLLNRALPAQQVWSQLQSLVENPLKALVSWCERFGMLLKDEGDFLRLNDCQLSRAKWMPLMARSAAASSSPKLLESLASKLGATACGADIAKACLYVHELPLGGQELGLARSVNLPMDARIGDLVDARSTGNTPFLVRYMDVSANADGSMAYHSGVVIGTYVDQDVLAQPAILGFNRTYQCQEGTEDGWLADLSFDSLEAARKNAREIQASGAEARILNRISGESVAV